MKLKQWQSVIQEQRIPHQLKLQSHQIEKLFSDHDQEAQVYGGGITEQTIRFDLSEQFEAGKEMLSLIKQELLTMFGVSSLQFMRNKGALQLQIERQKTNPVSLVNLVSSLAEIAPKTAILGLDHEGHPILHEFSDKSLSHILIQGGEGAGKSTLLRTIGVSLAMLNKQSQLQLVGLSLNSASQEVLKPLNYLPHVLEPLVESLADCQDLLAFLEEEMQYRLSQASATPTIVVLVDDVETLFQFPKIVNQLQNLLQKGPQTGIHFVLSHGAVRSAPFPEMLKANVPLKIVGQVVSAEEARLATGLVDSEAEYLAGSGDFMALFGESVFYFHAANVNEYELHLIIDRLHRNRPRPILAQSFVHESNDFYEADQAIEDQEELRFSYQSGHLSVIELASEAEEAASEQTAEEPVKVAEPVVVPIHEECVTEEKLPDATPVNEEQATGEFSIAGSKLGSFEPIFPVKKPIIKFAPKVRREHKMGDPQDMIPFDIGAPPDVV